jgi:hypothetical protein
MAALSIATDLGMGQPMEYAMSSCIITVRLGEAAGLAESELRDVYYEALLRYIGCNADTYWMSSLFGNELALRGEFATIDTADSARVLSLSLRYMRQANAGLGLPRLLQAMLQGFAQFPQINHSFSPATVKWLDGSGYYRSLNTTMLSPTARILATANRFCALCEARPHRAAYTPKMAADELNIRSKPALWMVRLSMPC